MLESSRLQERSAVQVGAAGRFVVIAGPPGTAGLTNPLRLPSTAVPSARICPRVACFKKLSVCVDDRLIFRSSDQLLQASVSRGG